MKKVKVISFQWPDPPDYGGVIDVYYKIQALLAEGVQVELHSFAYKRNTNTPLEKQLQKHVIYQRSMPILSWFLGKSYVVESRRNGELEKNVFGSSEPILIEGLHCSSVIQSKGNWDGNLVLRNHNIEHEYYEQLFNSETNPLKKFYFRLESERLKTQLNSIPGTTRMLSISTSDQHAFASMGFTDNHLIGPFHPFNSFQVQPGKGSYILYHGNLSVAENAKAAEFIITEIAAEIGFPIIIAGKLPSANLMNQAAQKKNVSIKANPTEKEMDMLIANAQIVLLPGTFQSGIKLKLMYSLFRGRHIITSPENLSGTGLTNQCWVASTKQEYIQHIYALFNQEFETEILEQRSGTWPSHLSNRENVSRLITTLFNS